MRCLRSPVIANIAVRLSPAIGLLEVVLNTLLGDHSLRGPRSSVRPMVSDVVSIRMRRMFAEVRKMFLNARHAEQDVRERQASRNFLA